MKMFFSETQIHKWPAKATINKWARITGRCIAALHKARIDGDLQTIPYKAGRRFYYVVSKEEMIRYLQIPSFAENATTY